MGIQVDLLRVARITGVTTQARRNNAGYAKTYEVHYGNDPTNLRPIMDGDEPKLFNGNQDTRGSAAKEWQDQVTNLFDEAIEARFVQIKIRDSHGRQGMRFDLVTPCTDNNAEWAAWQSVGCDATC